MLLCCSSCSTSFGTGTEQIHAVARASRALVTFDLSEKAKIKVILFFFFLKKCRDKEDAREKGRG